MNYKHVYMRIICNAKKEISEDLRPKCQSEKSKFPNQYFEFHHILPRSLFPNWTKRKSNIVPLTAREHFFCHQLLTKIYPSYEMFAALFRMNNCEKFKKLTTIQYESLKKSFSEFQSERRHTHFLKHLSVGNLNTGDGFGKINYKKQSKKSMKQIKFPKISEVRKGKGYPHTEAFKKMISEKTKGRKAPWAADSKLILGIQIYCKELNQTFCSVAEVKRFLQTKCNQFSKIMKIAKMNWFEYRSYHWKIAKLPEKRKLEWI